MVFGGNPTRARRTDTILGSNINNLEIKAVESRRHIFISRLSPETTEDQIKKHLLNNNIPTLQVEKLATRSNDIAAFKVQVPFSEMKKTFDSTIWPKYTILRPYRAPKKMTGNFLATQNQITTVN